MPGVGFSSIPILSSWIAAYRFTRAPLKLMTEGVTKYKPGYFRIATIQGEYVMVTDRNKVQEFLRQPDDVLSMQEAANDQQQIPFTMGWGIGHATYHNQVVRVHLTKSIEHRIEDMVDEIRHAFDDLIGAPADYQPVHIYKVIAMSVARTSNRIMVGKDFSENTEFLELAIAYAEAVVISAELIRAFPDWMKHVLIRLTPAWSRRWKAMKHLKPMLEKRLAGDFDGGKKPDDLMQWLMDAAPPGEERTIPKLVERIMSMNVASIHTTTMVSHPYPKDRGVLIHNLCRPSLEHSTSSPPNQRSTCPSSVQNSKKCSPKDPCQKTESQNSRKWTASSVNQLVTTTLG